MILSMNPVITGLEIKYCLNMDCKMAIETGRILDRRSIQAAQNILKKLFPEGNGRSSIQSLDDITCSKAVKETWYTFKGSSKCDQWITISTLYLKQGYEH